MPACFMCEGLRRHQLTEGFGWQEVEGSALPAVSKGALRARLVALQKRVYEEQKAAAAANKARAASAAVDAADAAVGAGQKFAIIQLDVRPMQSHVINTCLYHPAWPRAAHPL